MEALGSLFGMGGVIRRLTFRFSQSSDQLMYEERALRHRTPRTLTTPCSDLDGKEGAFGHCAEGFPPARAPERSEQRGGARRDYLERG